MLTILMRTNMESGLHMEKNEHAYENFLGSFSRHFHFSPSDIPCSFLEHQYRIFGRKDDSFSPSQTSLSISISNNGIRLDSKDFFLFFFVYFFFFPSFFPFYKPTDFTVKTFSLSSVSIMLAIGISIFPFGLSLLVFLS